MNGPGPSRTPPPPLLAERVLAAVVPPDQRDMILGDLTELFGQRVRRGRLAAVVWFWGQTVTFAVRFGLEGRNRRRAKSARARTSTGHPGTQMRWDMRHAILRLRQSVRRLVFDWRYALGVVAILGIGIGPAAAMLSVVERVLLRPLDYVDPDRIGLIRIDLGQVVSHPGLSHAEVRDLRGVDGLFATVEATSREFEISLGDGDGLVPVTATSVTPGLFSLLGVSPQLGRHFTDDDIDSSPVILSPELWRSQFGADPAIVGRTVPLNGIDTEVIGVMPDGFRVHLGKGSQISARVDLWRPLRLRDFRNFWAAPTLVRLADGVTFEQVNASLEGFARGLTERYPEHYEGTSLRFVLHPLLPDLVRETRPVMQAGLAGVALLLVIAVTNATALVVARWSTRELDLAVRSAIGAGRGTLVADAIVESAVLSAGGAAVGGALAFVGVSALRSFIPRTVPRWDTITVGWDVIGFAAGLALVGLLLAGLVPAFKVARGAPWQVLRGTSQQHSSARATGRLLLVGTQIAIGVVLTFGAVQLARSAWRLAETDLGFDPNVLTFRVPFEGRTFPELPDQAALYQRVRDRLRLLSGVTAVGAVSHLPLSGTGPVDAYTANLADSASMDQAMASYFAVQPGYLESVRIPLLRGRYFTDRENLDGAPVIIVDESLVAAVFPGEDPVGRTLRLGWGLPDSRIVGVVEHARTVDVSREVRPQIYVPYGLFPWSPLFFTVRADRNPRSLIAAARAAVTEAGTGRAVSRFQLLSDNVATATSALRAVTILVAALAVSAAFLSALGLYAVVSYVVHQARRATAIRSALGATPWRLLAHHLRNGSAILIVAVPTGVFLAAAAGRFLETLVYDVQARDLVSLSIAALLSAVAGLSGVFFPARRAAQTDPARVLRAE